MIETTLERIAVALERLASNAGATAAPAAEAAPAAKRGRPAKALETPPPPPPVDDDGEDDPFATDAPAPAVKLTREDVRSALVAYQKKTTPEKARGILKSEGGVDTLQALSEDKFAAVVAATKK